MSSTPKTHEPEERHVPKKEDVPPAKEAPPKKEETPEPLHGEPGQKVWPHPPEPTQ